MSRDPDLFEWAASRQAGVVIDATHRFIEREVAFIRLLIIGYKPPTSGGDDPIDLAGYRARIGSVSRPSIAKRRAAL